MNDHLKQQLKRFVFTLLFEFNIILMQFQSNFVRFFYVFQIIRIIYFKMSKKDLYKVILLGQSAVGKTSLLSTFVDQKFISTHKATLGADFSSKDIVVEGKLVNLVVWDTAGQQKFRSLGQAFYRGSACCILVYDITDKKSFEQIESWISIFLAQGDPKQPEKFPFVLIGNKIDKESERRVDQREITQFLQKHPKIIHLTASAKNRQGVQAAFEKAALAAMEYQKEEIFHPISVSSIKLRDKREKANKKACCST